MDKPISKAIASDINTRTLSSVQTYELELYYLRHVDTQAGQIDLRGIKKSSQHRNHSSEPECKCIAYGLLDLFRAGSRLVTCAASVSR